MKTITLALLSVSLLTAAAANHSWKIAKALDVSMEKYRDGGYRTTKRYLAVATDEFIYTVLDSNTTLSPLKIVGPAIGRKGCQSIVNDSVKVDESNNHKFLYVIDADGRECKAEIFRQERR